MSASSHIFFTCAIAMSFFLMASHTSADAGLPEASIQRQDTVIIEHADRGVRSVRNGMPVRELIGHVRLRQDSTFLRAHRVTQYLTLDEYLLVGEVMIVQKGDSLYADTVRYNSNLKTGRALGNVRLSDGEVEVFAPSALYFADEKHTIFDHNVRLVDSATVLTSLNGEYFSDEKRAEFFGQVVLEEDRTYLESDSVTYFRDTEVSIGYGHVFIERIGDDGADEEAAGSDSTTRTFLFGHYAYNDNRAGYSRIDGDALLIQLRQDSLGADVDSLLMKAASMEAHRKDSLQRLIAIDSVQIWRREFSAIADSAVYDRISREGAPLFEENRLFDRPMAWFDLYQLTGDTLRATARDGHIDSLFVRQNAFAAFQDTATNRINQLRGRHLLGLFRQDSLKNLAVGPQAESIYFRKTDDGQLGATKTSGDRILLFFSNDELEAIKVYAGIQGEYYDGALIPEPFELSGFRWSPDLKPTEGHLLNDAARIERLRQKLAAELLAKELDKPPRVSSSDLMTNDQ